MTALKSNKYSVSRKRVDLCTLSTVGHKTELKEQDTVLANDAV